MREVVRVVRDADAPLAVEDDATGFATDAPRHDRDRFLGRAVGIFAVSSLTSSGLGFSITRFACGSRNSIFATLVSSFSTAGPRGS